MTPADVTDEVRSTLDALQSKGLLLGIGEAADYDRRDVAIGTFAELLLLQY